MIKHVLFFLSAFLLLSSCKDDKSPVVPEPLPSKYVEVSFELTGAWAEDYTGTAALNKEHLYGIQVDNADGTHYAYGLFDDIRWAKLQLLPDSQYIVRMVAVPEGKKHCRFYSPYPEPAYGDMFEMMDDAGKYLFCSLENRFVYRKDKYFCNYYLPTYLYLYKIYGGSQFLSKTMQNKTTLSINTQRMYATVCWTNCSEKDCVVFLDCKDGDHLIDIDKRETLYESYTVCWPQNQDYHLPTEYSIETNYKIRFYPSGYETQKFPITIQWNKTTEIKIDMPIDELTGK